MIIRIEHVTSFTTIHNATLRDARLSWKARGLLAFFLTHSDSFQIRLDALASFSEQDGKDAIASGMKELKNLGYARFRKQQNPKTKQWLAGEWIVSETPSKRQKPEAENPESGKPGVRETLNQENRVLLKKEQFKEIPIKEIAIKEKHFFDAADLPVHLAKHPGLQKAWSEFVEYRKKDKRTPITKGSYCRLVKKMLAYSPDAIITAIDRAIESGWRGLFFRDTDMSVQSPREVKHRHSSNPLEATMIDMLQRNQIIYDERSISAQRIGVAEFVDKLPLAVQNHLDLADLWNGWIDFLDKKQRTFPAANFSQCNLNSTRWREYIKKLEYTHQYNFYTGEFQPQ